MRERFADGLWWRIALIVVTVLSPSPASAQTAASVPLSLNDAVQLALLNYPAIKESRARAQAAEEGIGVARTRVSAPARLGLAGEPSHDEQCVRAAAPTVNHPSDLWTSPWYEVPR